MQVPWLCVTASRRLCHIRMRATNINTNALPLRHIIYYCNFHVKHFFDFFLFFSYLSAFFVGFCLLFPFLTILHRLRSLYNPLFAVMLTIQAVSVLFLCLFFRTCPLDKYNHIPLNFCLSSHLIIFTKNFTLYIDIKSNELYSRSLPENYCIFVIYLSTISPPNATQSLPLFLPTYICLSAAVIKYSSLTLSIVAASLATPQVMVKY